MKRANFYICTKAKTFEKVTGYIDIITLYNGSIVELGVWRPNKHTKWILTELSSGVAVGITGDTIKGTFNELINNIKYQDYLIDGLNESEFIKELQQKLSDYIMEQGSK
jgi:hypothetical protein